MTVVGLFEHWIVALLRGQCLKDFHTATGFYLDHEEPLLWPRQKNTLGQLDSCYNNHDNNNNNENDGLKNSRHDCQKISLLSE